jgi:glutamyl-tRNA synthetase
MVRAGPGLSPVEGLDTSDSAMTTPVRVRYAPSPSGYLHIGGARTALFNWLWARKVGGTFVLRVEDTDQERSSLDSVRAVLDAMKWLGLDWDEGPEVGGPKAPYFQSERKPRYREVVEGLITQGKAYRCYCTKEELAKAREEHNAKFPKQPFVYPGTCRARRDAPEGASYVVRFMTPREGSTDFTDKVFGFVSTPNSQQYDFVLMRSDGFPLYNLACVVDDHDMEISLVARGSDHLGNTPHQLLIYQALGWPAPEFAHLPMMLDSKGAKLSKRSGSVAVQEYQEKGYTAEAVLNYIARFGWSFGDQEIFSREQLIQAFSWEGVNKADGRFDEKKFADIAFEHLKTPALMSTERYARELTPRLTAQGLHPKSDAQLFAAIETVRPRARTFADAATAVDFYFRDVPQYDEAAKTSFLGAAAVPVLEQMVALVAGNEPLVATTLETAFKAWVEAQGLKLKDAAQAVRVALTGRTASPGLFDVIVVLGRETTLDRLRRGLAIAEQQGQAQAPRGS